MSQSRPLANQLPTRAERIAAQSAALAEKQATMKREAAERRAEQARLAELGGPPAPASRNRGPSRIAGRN